MKKTGRKLALNRETLRFLEGVVGGYTAGICDSGSGGRPGDGGTDSSWCNSAGVCSNDCQTGGACTLSSCVK